MNTENKLPEDFKQKWVAALRSGEYKQGQGQMRLDDKFCCLAIASIVAGVDPNSISGNYPYQLELKDREKVPKVIRCSEHLEDADLDPANVLANMNDSGKSFSEIADYIEQNL